jgi:hypothetical protein
VHALIDRAALLLVPPDVPSFFTRGEAAIVFYAADPDSYRERSLPALRSAEAPDHFIDMEHLRDRELPPTREEFSALCRELGTDPWKTGALPYAIAEWHDRLALAFAEHRKWPEDERVRWKALYVAGILSHYAADAAQPLHTTVHFDGWAGKDGVSPRSGIHARMDALPVVAGLTPKEMAEGSLPDAQDGAFSLAVRVIGESHNLVDRVYGMEGLLPDPAAPRPVRVDPKAKALALDCSSRAARAVAAAWLSAWKRSAEVRLPEWRTP